MIESTQNEHIKRLQRLINKNSERKKNKIFVVEGIQENERALRFGFQPQEFFICEAYFQGEIPTGILHYVHPKVYAKIAYRGTTEGIIGIYHEKENPLSRFKIEKENVSVVLLESPEKPGNLGAVLRSCEAFGIDAIIITETKTDFYNPNVIRSSVGCLFGMNFFQTSNQEAYDFFIKNDFQILTTFMEKNFESLPNLNLKKKNGFCFGTEHSGLSDFWKNKGKNFLIPMAGTIDSINLSNAVAITCYENLRQNQEKNK